MSTRTPAMRDAVAIVGIGRTAYSRFLPWRSAGSLVLEAVQQAIYDSGLPRGSVTGICGGGLPAPVAPEYVSQSLGLHGITYWTTFPVVYGFGIANAVNAITAGQCNVAIVYHCATRTPSSRGTPAEVLRARSLDTGAVRSAAYPEDNLQVAGYAMWAARYQHEYGLEREKLARIAINGRTNAGRNPHAPLREPMSLEDYMGARMVRDPLSMLDMDLPIDGATAMVLTSAERARDLPHRPVLVHAASFGLTDHPREDQQVSLKSTGQQIAARALWERSELGLGDIDVFFPYDGFSIITVNWCENIGYCAQGEGLDFIGSHWDEKDGHVMIDGRVPLNPHGGSLSEGATQGAGHFHEAVTQLRGDAQGRQAAGADVALLCPGGFFQNSQSFILRGDS